MQKEKSMQKEVDRIHKVGFSGLWRSKQLVCVASGTIKLR